MKIIELEGTPEELVAYRLLMERAAGTQVAGAELPKPKEPMRLTPDGGLPPKLLAFVDSRLGPGVDREVILEALKRALAIGPDIEARVGSFKDTADGLSSYVMLFRRNSGVGALCYLEPSNAGSSHRVPLGEAKEPSVPRRVQEADPYKVNLGITSADRIEEFVRLVSKAYELAKKRLYSGKVREMYDAGPDHLLMVASDRISAFDVVFGEPIPDKGRVLTAMTAFWAEALAPIARTHLVSLDVAEFPDETREIDDLVGRSMLVRRAEMLPIECIVRGYLTGSAWREYVRSGTMHGTPLPAGLLESAELPEPVFTPSTKATEGHDENISFEAAVNLIGSDLAHRAEELCLAAYRAASQLALERGIVIADTKFELGLIDRDLVVCDEILTPDSSRFWPKDQWQLGSTPPSFDKQPVRDWAESTGWDKKSAPPTIPDAVIAATRDRYVRAYEQLSQRRFADWPGVGSPG